MNTFVVKIVLIRIINNNIKSKISVFGSILSVVLEKSNK